MDLDNPSQLRDLLTTVTDIARSAGREIAKIYAHDFEIAQKSDKSPLTTADLASHDLILSNLQRLTPKIPVLSEESQRIPFNTRAAWRCHWLVDPLDGTKEFIKRNDEFVVNIALIQDTRPVLGVVYVPVKRVCYSACRGQGAYRQDAKSAATSIQTRKSSTERIIVVGSRSHASKHLRTFLDRLGSYELLCMGSALKLCMVAEGSADLYPRFGTTSEWDTAAAHCILEEAGGCLTDLQRLPLRYNTKESVENPAFVGCGDCDFDWSVYL